MVRLSSIRSWCGTGVVAILVGCGGGGGGGVGGPPPTVIAKPAAMLRDGGGHGVSALALIVWSDGHLQGTLPVDAPWAPQLTSIPLREGPVGSPGAVVVDLKPGSTFDPLTSSWSVSASIDPATAAAIAANPPDYHVALLVTGTAGDFAHGPLVSSASAEVHADLLDNPTASDGHCVLTATVDSAGEVHWIAAFAHLSVMDVTALRVTRGSPQPVLIDLNVAGATRDAVKRTIQHDESPALANVLRVVANPGLFEVQVDAMPPGPASITGPLAIGPLDAVGVLRGQGGSLAGAGVAIRFDTFQTGKVTVAVPGGGGPTLDDLASIQIAEGTTGSPGPMLFEVMNGSLQEQADHLSGQNAVVPTQELVARMAVDPAAFHAQIQVAGGPEVLAADLAGSEPRFFAELGETGTTSGGEPGAAATDLWVASADSVLYQIESANPAVDSGSLAAAVAHPVGTLPTTAPSPYDLLGASVGTQIMSGNVLTGRATLDPDRVARLLADPGDLALSLTTTLAPDGVARGPFRDGSLCDAKYIPPFEGLWSGTGNSFNMSRDPGPPTPCGDFTGVGTLGGVPVEMTGTYDGSHVDVTISTPNATTPTETAVYEGTIDTSVVLSTMDTVSTLPPAVDAPHGTIHGLFGRLWLSGGDYTLVMTTFPSPNPDEDSVAGFLTCRGVMIPFTGTEVDGDVNLTFDLTGIDLSPCPAALQTAWNGLASADVSGNLTEGVGALFLDAPISTTFDRPDR